VNAPDSPSSTREPDDLLRNAGFAVATLRYAVKGFDDNGELAEWFRPGFLRDTVAPMLEALVARIRSEGDEVTRLRAALAAVSEERDRLNAAAELCADDVTWFCRNEAFVSGSDDDPNAPIWLAVNCNDMFAPAADSEEIALSEAPALLSIWKRDAMKGVKQFVAERRSRAAVSVVEEPDGRT
jgi:hypothetical protein